MAQHPFLSVKKSSAGSPWIVSHSNPNGSVYANIRTTLLKHICFLLICDTMVHSNIDFQLQLWSQDISGHAAQLQQVWPAELPVAKACSQTCFPRKTLVSRHKDRGKRRGTKWLRKQSYEYLYTWPACLSVFRICILRKALWSSSEPLLSCLFFWVLKAQWVT